ncbi:MAG TPA: glycosyltransferase family 9 protein [Phycisphaerales bacterium]|nr:glycosyltransferase family 9 protein [Phycisphaerales bacterium]
MPNTPKNILILKPSALGDIVLALPALASLRASSPEAKITWFVRPEFAPLLNSVPNLDDMIIFDRKLLGKWWCCPKAFAELVRLVTKLRKGEFDLVIDLQGLLRTAIFSWFTGCKKRFGMKKARELASIFYTHKISLEDNAVHVIDCYEKIITATGASKITLNYDLSPTPEAVESVTKLLAEYELTYGNYIVFIAGAAHSHKCWPPEYFAALAERINAEFTLPVIAIGTKTEKQIIENIKANTNVPIVNFAGLTDISQLVAILSGASLTVTNDTGPGHIAVALGKPVVMIFGPTNPARINPYRCKNAIVAIDPNGRGSEIDSSDPIYAIEAVSVDLVFEKVAWHLKHQKADN